jgi:hypothetical protein
MGCSHALLDWSGCRFTILQEIRGACQHMAGQQIQLSYDMLNSISVVVVTNADCSPTTIILPEEL